MFTIKTLCSVVNIKFSTCLSKTRVDIKTPKKTHASLMFCKFYELTSSNVL